MSAHGLLDASYLPPLLTRYGIELKVERVEDLLDVTLDDIEPPLCHILVDLFGLASEDEFRAPASPSRPAAKAEER
ncbi:hypothetical protein BJ958_004283 [Nocardioides kongjuensis]|uniref:Uncharacterized protein n=1 Tax=Nocardioides kongjuensis TaxID=349522 RepID=A0A852RH81_9ACTN|nr:hypothetical protein [Nocardioides kongjuensis]